MLALQKLCFRNSFNLNTAMNISCPITTTVDTKVGWIRKGKFLHQILPRYFKCTAELNLLRLFDWLVEQLILQSLL